MKTIKEERGAITIIALVTMLFLVSFLVSTYVIAANRLQSQKEVLEETRNIYKSPKTMEEIYNSYFANENLIPIYTVEQLLKIGTEENINIDGKIYTLSNSANYILMNDLSFKVEEWSELLDGEEWIPIGDNIDFEGTFEGNNNKITVIYDDEGEEYSVVYSKQENFSEPEYQLKIIPKLTDETIATNTNIYINDVNTGILGEQIISVKRKKLTTIKLVLNENYEDISTELFIVNPNKIEGTYNQEEKLYEMQFEMQSK